MKMQDMKMTDKNDDRARSCRRTNRVSTVCKFLNPKHRNTLYGFIPACAQVGRLSPLCFNPWYFSNWSRLQRSNAKSTQSIQPETFPASESASYYAALLCPAISCPAHWSVNFTSVIFTSSIFTAPLWNLSLRNGICQCVPSVIRVGPTEMDVVKIPAIINILPRVVSVMRFSWRKDEWLT